MDMVFRYNNYVILFVNLNFLFNLWAINMQDVNATLHDRHHKRYYYDLIFFNNHYQMWYRDDVLQIIFLVSVQYFFSLYFNTHYFYYCVSIIHYTSCI